jgi:hypothetical protein
MALAGKPLVIALEGHYYDRELAATFDSPEGRAPEIRRVVAEGLDLPRPPSYTLSPIPSGYVLTRCLLRRRKACGLSLRRGGPAGLTDPPLQKGIGRMTPSRRTA